MTDIVIDEEFVTREELTPEERVKEDDQTDIAVIRLRYRILANRKVLQVARQKKEALTAGTTKRLNRNLKELTR